MVLAKAPRKGEAHQYAPLVNIPSDVRESVPLIYIGTNRSLKEHGTRLRHGFVKTELVAKEHHVSAQRGADITDCLAHECM